MKLKIIKKIIRYESTIDLLGIRLPCYILEDGTKLLTEEEVRKVLRETVSSIQKLALTSLSKTRKEFSKTISNNYFQLFTDFIKDDEKIKLDKLLDACTNTPPLKLKTLKKRLRKRRQ